MSETNQPWWTITSGPILNQGDWLRGCKVPLFRNMDLSNSRQTVDVHEYDCIVLTQSCDLANDPPPLLVALCPLWTIPEFERDIPDMTKSGKWNNVRRGRVEGLHLLASPNTPVVGRESLVVDFRQIYSLPYQYLSEHAASLSDRCRLRPPFLEHFSQAFARFFMRVGLPSGIPEF